MLWTDFEHSIWKQFKRHNLAEHNTFVLAISGGLDSMVLLESFKKIKPKSRLIVAHFHHGDSEDIFTQDYRDKALKLVKSVSDALEIPFFTDKSTIKLTSEDDFRKSRFAFFEKIKKDFPDSVLVTAHHKDDLLETWLLKMIRGVGPEGLENFKFWNGQILRPLLGFSKIELAAYANLKNVNWVEDPTNNQTDYLRNWLRNEWLPQLSGRVSGAIDNLANSMQRLILEVTDSEDLLNKISFSFSPQQTQTKAQFNRSEFLQLSHSDQFKVIAKVLKCLGQREFSQGQLEEIIKRLDKNQKDLTFSITGVNWFIKAQQVVVELIDRTRKSV